MRSGLAGVSRGGAAPFGRGAAFVVVAGLAGLLWGAGCSAPTPELRIAESGDTVAPPDPQGIAGPGGGEGCADGEREGFVDPAESPNIAGCSGGFQVPGMLSDTETHCGRGAGDDSRDPTGKACSSEDLCATGWHVCKSAAEVAERSPSGCRGVVSTGEALFFATRQSSPGCGLCATGTLEGSGTGCETCACVAGCRQNNRVANDLFGCGTLGDAPPDCGVLDRFSNNVCLALGAPWSCGGDGCLEARAVVKPGPERGGVLCCRD